MTMTCILGTYLSPGLVLNSEPADGWCFPYEALHGGLLICLRKSPTPASLFSVILTHPNLRPPLPALKASATDTKVCVKLNQFQQAQAWKGGTLRPHFVYPATLKSLPPTGLVSEQTACSYSEWAQT